MKDQLFDTSRAGLDAGVHVWLPDTRRETGCNGGRLDEGAVLERHGKQRKQILSYPRVWWRTERLGANASRHTRRHGNEIIRRFGDGDEAKGRFAP